MVPRRDLGLTSAERDVEDQMLGREELVDGAARRGVVGHGRSKRRSVDRAGIALQRARDVGALYQERNKYVKFCICQT